MASLTIAVYALPEKPDGHPLLCKGLSGLSTSGVQEAIGKLSKHPLLPAGVELTVSGDSENAVLCLSGPKNRLDSNALFDIQTAIDDARGAAADIP